MLRHGTYFVDDGPTHYVRRRRDLIAKRSVRRLEELGFKGSAGYAGVLQPLYCAWPADRIGSALRSRSLYMERD